MPAAPLSVAADDSHRQLPVAQAAPAGPVAPPIEAAEESLRQLPAAYEPATLPAPKLPAGAQSPFKAPVASLPGELHPQPVSSPVAPFLGPECAADVTSPVPHEEEESDVRSTDVDLRSVQARVWLEKAPISALESRLVEATADTAWGPPQSLVRGLAAQAHIPSDRTFILQYLFLVLEERDTRWRRTGKALLLLEALLKRGSVAGEEIRRELWRVEQWCGHCATEGGRTTGLSISRLAESIVGLCADPMEAQRERAIATWWSGAGGISGSSSRSESSAESIGSARSPGKGIQPGSDPLDGLDLEDARGVSMSSPLDTSGDVAMEEVDSAALAGDCSEDSDGLEYDKLSGDLGEESHPLDSEDFDESSAGDAATAERDADVLVEPTR